MQKLLLAGLLAVAAASPAFAQAEPENESASVGYELDRFQNEFGVGINATTPYFLNGSLAVQVAAVHAWYSGIVGTDETWVGYNTYKLGVVGSHRVTTHVRTYGVGGIALVAPNKDVSRKKTVSGGYGGFGFEFLNNPNLTYFIELGGIGTGLRADKLPGKPIYSNGFLETVGMRVYFQ